MLANYTVLCVYIFEWHVMITCNRESLLILICHFISGGELDQHTLTDVRNVYIYENQRWNPVTGYTDK